MTSRRTTKSTLVSLPVLVLLGMASASPSEAADAAAFRECNVVNGKAQWCGPWYQGTAVTHHDGAYRACKIVNGQRQSCGPWYQGTAVAHHDGAYRACKIVNGQLQSCGPWYQGTAVLFERSGAL